MKKVAKKIAKQEEKNLEQGARRAVLEDLFYDFNRSRAQIYKINFIRGIVFGLGSALGGTVILALAIWLLTLFTDVVPGLNGVLDTVEGAAESSVEQ